MEMVRSPSLPALRSLSLLTPSASTLTLDRVSLYRSSKLCLRRNLSSFVCCGKETLAVEGSFRSELTFPFFHLSFPLPSSNTQVRARCSLPPMPSTNLLSIYGRPLRSKSSTVPPHRILSLKGRSVDLLLALVDGPCRRSAHDARKDLQASWLGSRVSVTCEAMDSAPPRSRSSVLSSKRFILELTDRLEPFASSPPFPTPGTLHSKVPPSPYRPVRNLHRKIHGQPSSRLQASRPRQVHGSQDPSSSYPSQQDQPHPPHRVGNGCRTDHRME